MEPHFYNLIAALLGCVLGLIVASYVTWMRMTGRVAKITSESASTIATSIGNSNSRNRTGRYLLFASKVAV